MAFPPPRTRRDDLVELNPAWSRAGRASVSKTCLSNESYFLECPCFGATWRRDQIHDLVRDTNADLVCLIETFKAAFSTPELSSITGADRFVWRCLRASGHSGGIHIGARVDVFDFVAFDHGIFWASMVVYHKSLNVLWEIMVVHGPADQTLSLLFLNEIAVEISPSHGQPGPNGPTRPDATPGQGPGLDFEPEGRAGPRPGPTIFAIY